LARLARWHTAAATGLNSFDAAAPAADVDEVTAAAVDWLVVMSCRLE